MSFQKILKQYKKQGGSDLIKYYYKSHVLSYALCLAPLLISNQTGQELFREAISNKIQKKFYKKYLHYKVDLNYLQKELVGQAGQHRFVQRPVWFCWFQGIEHAPELVKLNYKNLQHKLGNDRVILITADNFLNYVKLPKKLLVAWKTGKIPNTQFSDLLRAELLTENGGIWLDSTVYLSSNQLPNYFNDDFFIYQTLKPGRNGLAMPISNWALASKPNEELIKRTRDLLFSYYLSGQALTEYFLFHRFFMVALAERPDLGALITKVDNSQPHALLIAMQQNPKISPSDVRNFLSLSSVHKLTNKIKNDKQKQNLASILLEIDHF
ncbi:capsular polysaccharide synthesis protein [Oenococcus oeni]|uniref:capsular polysaccharide synthesis protein n=1 Tax=Oenococcus oeni TaxID=1247 RepID=UPI0010B5501A|nr:capsular polysaccharide synthesis protein [Oenococcus oeni]SYW14875.1 conserved hypothetical protein [Oenococcus oeni]